MLVPLAVEVGAVALANPATTTAVINGVAEAGAGNALGGATLTAGVALTAKQVANLARFEKKLPTGNTGVAVDQLDDEVVFTASVPGNVPGSQAVYQKTVDALGETTSYLKTTFSPRNDVIHIKDKLNPPAELPKY